MIDVSTVTRTIAGPGAMGVDTRFAVLDAGYHANASADALMGARVPILARTGPNPGAHGEVVDGLEARENAVMHNGRLACAKCVPVGIGSRGDRRGYAYLCLDSAMRREPGRDAARRAAEGGLSGAEAHDSMASRGVFVLAGTRRIARGKLLPLCYTRDRVEKVFEIAKQGGKALPVCVRSEGTLGGAPAHVPRGHRGDQDDVGRAGLAQDLARGRVDAGDPARAARDGARRAAGHHRAREEDERGARGLRDQVPGHHRAASCGLRKCRELRLVLRSS